MRRILIFFAAALALSNANKRYDEYQVLQIFPRANTHHSLISQLAEDVELDFWHTEADHVDILVPPHKLFSLKETLRHYQVEHSVKISNLQSEIDSEMVRLANKKRGPGKAIDYDDFNTLEDIHAELDALAARCPAGVSCVTGSIGLSIEGREIKGIRVFKSDPNRKAIWLEATTHAREWLSTATHLKIMKHLIDDYETDAQARDLVDRYDWYLFPVVNPDGYSFTWGDGIVGDRMWRKNRRNNTDSTCPGVDINRNYNQMWGNAGSSQLACSATYRGVSPASEPETQAIQSAVCTVASSLLFMVSLHTYGNLWLIPWGSYADDGQTCRIADDDAEMMLVANAAADAVEATHGTTWERGNSCATIYPASGITMDYAKGVCGVKYAATPELRGNSFIVPAAQIAPSFEEVWNGLTTAIETIENASN